MALTVVTAPAAEPLTMTETKLHLRVDIADDDTLISALITAAREYAEQVTRRALITQTLRYSLDGWPDGDRIALPMPPLQSVNSIVYTDDESTEATLSTDDYLVDSEGIMGQVVLKSTASWPSTTLRDVNGVQITYVAGYGDAGSDVPQPILQAMLLMIGHWYENREAILTTGAMPKALPLAVEALLWPYRVINWP